MKSIIIFFIISTIGVVFATNEAALKEFMKANNLFASNVYMEIINKPTENFVVSPYSAEIILSLTRSGCKDETAQEIKRVLSLPDDDDQIDSGVKDSLTGLTSNEHYTLESANKMYVKDGFPIKENFKNIATNVYGAEVENIDFVKNVAAANTMNKWVEHKTHNKIKNLIDPSILDEYSRVVLINALYFKGNWSTQFHSSETVKRDFHNLDGNIVKVDMMHHHRKMFNFYESSELDAKFLELTFEGGDVSMVIALPNRKNGLSDLEKHIYKVFHPHQLRKTLVNVLLPKFKIESTIKLADILKHMGMQKAFNEEEADLSGIAGDKGDLVISDVLQKAFVEIDEKGGEAAAATYVHVSYVRAGARYIAEPKEFIADHPFIFYIKANGFIIFAGRVIKPSH